MTPERWRRIEDLFDAASELDAAARSGWLAEHCGGDSELLAEVERMLASDAVARASLEGAVDSAVESIDPPAGLQTGLRIGSYEVLSEIGRGGMGVVYLARRADDVFRKEVALKVVRGGLDTGHVLERFKQERRILARLEHPYIARILDGGSTADGSPFLVLEYVKGQPVTTYSKTHGLGLRQRLELFRKVCAAVQYAHQNLVVHRDLKPGNIFVDETGDPKLLDFGIAKLLDSEPEAAWTVDAGRLLTPQYASPEQVNGEPVTAASDVYSLGAVLYELLTGKTAHQLSGLSGAAYYKEICEKEVTRASLSAEPDSPAPSKDLEGDLDNILRMALEKDPRRRYATADHLSEDIRRYLQFQPVLAGASSLRYRTLKFVRRNRGSVAAAVLVTASLLGGIATTSYQARRAERRFQEGRHLASSFVFEVYDALAKLPGGTKARELVVNRALDYLKKMEREAPDDPGLQFELATAYRKIADVQGNVIAANLGDLHGALGNYETAERLLRRVLDLKPDDRPARLELVKVLNVEARTHRHTGDTKQALDDFRRASEAAAPLTGQSKEALEARAALGSALESMAQLQRESGDGRAALETSQRGVDILEQMLRDAPERDETREQLAAALSSMAMSRARTKDLNGAVAAARRAVDLLEAMRSRRQQDAGFQRSLMQAYGALGDLLGNPTLPSLGDRAGAEGAYRSAVLLAESLATADPDNRLAQTDLAIVLTRLGGVFPPEQSAEAIAAYDRSYAVFRSVSAADPNNLNTRMNMAFSLVRRAERKLELPGKRDEVLNDLRTAREICRAVLSRKPGEVNTGSVYIRVLSVEARALFKAGQNAAALTLAQEALAFAGRPNPARSHFSDGLVHARAFDVMAAVSPRAEACFWFQKSLAAWDALKDDPNFNVVFERERKQAMQAAAPCH